MPIRACFVLLAITIGCDHVASPPPKAEHFIIINEALNGPRRQELFRRVVRLICEDAVPGEWVHLIAAPSYQPIASIPVARGNRNRRLRSPQAAGQLQALSDWFETDRVGYSQQLDFAQTAAVIEGLRKNDLPCQVTMVGTPIYHDQQHAGMSMRGWRVPNDGCLKSRTPPFGAGVLPFPPGTKVALITPIRWGDDHVHREYATRWWRLFFQHYGAECVAVSPDIENGFRFDRSQFTTEVVARPSGSGTFNVKSGSSERDFVSGKKHDVVREGEVAAFGDETVDRMIAAAKADKSVTVVAVHYVGDDPERQIELVVGSEGSPEELSPQNDRTGFGALYSMATHSVHEGKDVFQHFVAARINHDRAADLNVWLHVVRSAEPVSVRLVAVSKGRIREGLVKTPAIQNRPANDDRTTVNGWRRVSLAKSHPATGS